VRIKVAQVISRLNVGGPAVHVIHLAERMDRRRFDLRVIAGREREGEGSLIELAKSRGVMPIAAPDIVAEASLKPRDLRAIAALAKRFRAERPDVVHTHTAKAGFVGRLAARLARVPVVLHTFHGHILEGYYSAPVTGILRGMESALARISTRLIAVSESVRADLVRLGVAPVSRIDVVPLALDLDRFQDAGATGGFRRELGLHDGEVLFGIVGRIFPIKNHRLFLQAGAEVLRADARARLAIVGDGVLRNTMEQLASELGIRDRVFFVGWRTDLPVIYRDLDALVISSDNEGAPVAALEAMACGCPVVATHVGGVPDIVSPGQTGLLVPPRNAAALASAMRTLAEDSEIRRSLGRSAQARVRERFDTRARVAQMEQLYEELLSRARPPAHSTASSLSSVG
jgi:glycosyltransferase involved in cell wall biosynthesis